MKKELIKKFIEKNNIQGNLKKVLLDQDVEIPDGMEAEDLIEKEINSHLEERVDFFKTKYGEKMVKDAIDSKAKEFYPATINPIRKKAITLFDLDKEKYAESDPKDLLDAIYERQKEQIKNAASSKNEDVTKLRESLEDYKKELIEERERVQNLTLQMKKEVETAREEARSESEKFIAEDLFGRSFDKISGELILNGRSLLDTMKIKLRDNGYTYAIENDSKGKKVIVPRSLDGTSAMSLGGNRKIDDLSELMLEIAAKERLKKVNNNSLEEVGVFTTSRGDKKVTHAGASFLSKKLNQSL